MTYRIAVANHKGGSGKTTTAHSLGAALAEAGHKVLLIDMDPQSSLTEACGVADATGQSMAEVIGGATPGRVRLPRIVVPVGNRLHLAPSSIDLAAAQLGLAARLVGRDMVLRRELDALGERFDVVLIDCPPSLDLLTLNGLMAARYVLIPTKPQIVDLRGLRLFLQTLEEIKPSNPELEVLGILLTFWRGFNLHKRALGVLEQDGLRVLATRIGESVRVAESPEVGQSIVDFAPTNARSVEYRQLASEVLECLNRN